MNDITMQAAQWRELCQRIFQAWGAPEDIAACVANSLVEADLAGVYSHGVVRIGNYYNFVKPGWWHPEQRPEVIRESAAMAIVDGHWGFGQPAVHKGLQLGIEKARAQGIAGVGIVRTGHIGR
ncbi:MAG: Ldh family oxidoreductase [Anaerolineae bacterium]|nr:Ldh family oxidoreductase [Anaerolineae bacterium]